jgi:hypothetical protein
MQQTPQRKHPIEATQSSSREVFVISGDSFVDNQESMTSLRKRHWLPILLAGICDSRTIL